MFFIQIAERLSRLTGAIGAFLVVPLIGALIFEVFSRYLLGRPTAWAYEVSYMLMGGIFLLGLGYALKVRQHVNVDLLYGRFSPRSRAIADLLGYCLFLPAVCWLTIELFDYAREGFASGEVSGLSAWNPVIWPFRSLWFVGFLVLGLQTFAECLKALAVVFRAQPVGGYA